MCGAEVCAPFHTGQLAFWWNFLKHLEPKREKGKESKSKFLFCTGYLCVRALHRCLTSLFTTLQQSSLLPGVDPKG